MIKIKFNILFFTYYVYYVTVIQILVVVPKLSIPTLQSCSQFLAPVKSK